MAITCRDLFNLDSIRDLKLEAGEKGLDNVVTWVYIGEDTKPAEWGRGGELLFITGIGMDRSEEGLVKLIEECYSSKLSGLVISTNDLYIKEITEKLKKTANALNFPIFTIPWSLRRIEILKELTYLIINEQQHDNEKMELLKLMKKERLDEDEKKDLKHLVGILGAKNNHKLFSCVFELTYTSNQQNKNIQSAIEQEIKNSFFRNNVIVIIEVKTIYCLIYDINEENEKEYVYNILEILAKDFKSKGGIKRVYVGGCIGEEAENISINNAKIAMRISKKLDDKGGIRIYDDLGIYRIIYKDTRNSERVKYCKKVLKNVISYDEQSAEKYMIDTIIAYYESMFNVSQTAKNLFIHRNSLMYRINKLEELTKKDLKNPNDAMDLAYCALAIKYFS